MSIEKGKVDLIKILKKMIFFIDQGFYDINFLINNNKETIIKIIAEDMKCEEDLALGCLGHLLKFNYIKFDNKYGIIKLKDFKTIEEMYF